MPEKLFIENTTTEQNRNKLIAENHFHYNLKRWRDDTFVPHGLPAPTEAIPGTSEKIAVLKARLESGVALHHPNDRWSKEAGHRPSSVG